MTGKFHNAECDVGWKLAWLRNERWAWFWRTAIFRFRLLDPPLTWEDSEGYWQPDQHEAETDFGSIPPPLQGLISPMRYALTFIFHDSVCVHNGLWFSKTIEGPYSFRPLTRRQGDAMTLPWVQAEGGTICKWWIWAGVRIGAIFGGKK